MPKLSVDVSLEQFIQIIQGAEKSPLFFVQKLVSDITALCFTQKLKTNETLEQRQDTIHKVWKACEESNNEYLIDLVAKKALSCKKTGNKNAYRILKFLARNYTSLYAVYSNSGTGLGLYADAHLKSLKNYFRFGWQTIEREYVQAEDLLDIDLSGDEDTEGKFVARRYYDDLINDVGRLVAGVSIIPVEGGIVSPGAVAVIDELAADDLNVNVEIPVE